MEPANVQPQPPVSQGTLNTMKISIPWAIAIAVIIFAQLAIVVCRFTWKGVAYYRLLRTHALFNFELVMFVASIFVYRRVRRALDVMMPHEVSPVRRRLMTICLHDVTKATLLLFICLSHLSFAFYYIFLGDEPNLLAIISLSSVAFYLHVLILLFLAELIQVITLVASKANLLTSFHSYVHKNRDTYTLLAVLCAFILISGGLFTTYRDPVYKHVNIPIKKMNSGTSAKISLLSDIHIGPTVGENRMKTITRLTNELNPDIIAISGDLADGFVSNFKNAAEPLCHLKAKHGVYFATGNHEYMHGNVDEWFDFLKSCNITVLHNENRRFALDESNVVCIAGTDDLYAAKSHFPGHAMDQRKALKGCEPTDIVVVLAHQPNAAKIILKDNQVNDNVDLILSGHTHGGQMYMLVPAVYIANAFVRGLYYYKATDAYVYVSAGVNFFGPPVKMFGACEIIDINLVPRT